jgi:hypothetical protein
MVSAAMRRMAPPASPRGVVGGGGGSTSRGGGAARARVRTAVARLALEMSALESAAAALCAEADAGHHRLAASALAPPPHVAELAGRGRARSAAARGAGRLQRAPSLVGGDVSRGNDAAAASAAAGESAPATVGSDVPVRRSSVAGAAEASRAAPRTVSSVVEAAPGDASATAAQLPHQAAGVGRGVESAARAHHHTCEPPAGARGAPSGGYSSCAAGIAVPASSEASCSAHVALATPASACGGVVAAAGINNRFRPAAAGERCCALGPDGGGGGPRADAEAATSPSRPPAVYGSSGVVCRGADGVSEQRAPPPGGSGMPLPANTARPGADATAAVAAAEAAVAAAPSDAASISRSSPTSGEEDASCSSSSDSIAWRSAPAGLGARPRGVGAAAAALRVAALALRGSARGGGGSSALRRRARWAATWQGMVARGRCPGAALPPALFGALRGVYGDGDAAKLLAHRCARGACCCAARAPGCCCLLLLLRGPRWRTAIMLMPFLPSACARGRRGPAAQENSLSRSRRMVLVALEALIFVVFMAPLPAPRRRSRSAPPPPTCYGCGVPRARGPSIPAVAWSRAAPPEPQCRGCRRTPA